MYSIDDNWETHRGKYPQLAEKCGKISIN